MMSAKSRTNGRCAGILGKPLSAVTNGAGSTEADRGSNGRFLPGNKLGRGNPCYRRLAKMRLAVLSAVNEHQLVALAKGLYTRAVDGDLEATKLLLAYLVGKPRRCVDPDRADHHEFELLQDRPDALVVVDAALNGIDPVLAAAIVEVSAPTTPEKCMRKVFNLDKSEMHMVVQARKAKLATK